MTHQASGYNFGGSWWCVWPSKHSNVAAMYHCLEQRCALRAVHTLNPPTNHIYLLRRYLPFHLMRRHGVQGLTWGVRGPFPPVVAMVVTLVVCWCSMAGAPTTLIQWAPAFLESPESSRCEQDYYCVVLMPRDWNKREMEKIMSHMQLLITLNFWII